jgi:DNA-binding NarL/FixJ family response regulator
VTAARTRVAIVDDHVQFRGVLREVIEQIDLVDVAWEAADGLAAIETMRESPVDVVVVDLSLPGINGIELIKRIKAGWPDVHALVVTGHTEHSYVEDAYAAGALAYVLKGRPEDLRAGVVASMQGRPYTSPSLEGADPVSADRTRPERT